jgi:hypothetical protein
MWAARLRALSLGLEQPIDLQYLRAYVVQYPPSKLPSLISERARARCPQCEPFDPTRWLRDYALDHLAVHVGESEVAALEAIGQPCVIDTQ